MTHTGATARSIWYTDSLLQEGVSANLDAAGAYVHKTDGEQAGNRFVADLAGGLGGMISCPCNK